MTASQIAAHFAIAKPTRSADLAMRREPDLVLSRQAGTSFTSSPRFRQSRARSSAVPKRWELAFARVVCSSRRPGVRSHDRS